MFRFETNGHYEQKSIESHILEDSSSLEDIRIERVWERKGKSCSERSDRSENKRDMYIDHTETENEFERKDWERINKEENEKEKREIEEKENDYER